MCSSVINLCSCDLLNCDINISSGLSYTAPGTFNSYTTGTGGLPDMYIHLRAEGERIR